MRRYKRPPCTDFGAWHDGDRYAVRVGCTLNVDNAGYRTVSDVEIRDKVTGVTLLRRGRGRQSGNFHPIWVSIHGQEYTLEALLRVTRPLGNDD